MNDKITLHKDTNLFGVDLKAGVYVRKKEWVGLTNKERVSIWRADQMTQAEWDELFDEIEAKLKEKNT